ncbi:hypothetical protein F4779DRAFT_223486 [Xylariaceae sp. FL0662B]|nr:hypothetical protein F4779DRAFT_223486 [Xylariaceae sp. FL0662B]
MVRWKFRIFLFLPGLHTLHRRVTYNICKARCKYNGRHIESNYRSHLLTLFTRSIQLSPVLPKLVCWLEPAVLFCEYTRRLHSPRCLPPLLRSREKVTHSNLID